jgi:3-hydroxyacyl-CoA dehydrogenase
LEEGASPEQIDRVIRAFGFPMGPFAMGDLAGLDVGWRIRKRRHAEAPPAGRYSKVADQLCELGRYGQKTGAGYYRYAEGSRTPIPDPLVDELAERAAREAGIERRAIGDDEILERCMYPLVNEAAKILEEGIAARPGDVDVVWVYGYGFPAWRGGPLRWADAIGLRKIVDDMLAFEARHGAEWAPAPLLRDLAERGGTFGALRLAQGDNGRRAVSARA